MLCHATIMYHRTILTFATIKCIIFKTIPMFKNIIFLFICIAPFFSVAQHTTHNNGSDKKSSNDIELNSTEVSEIKTQVIDSSFVIAEITAILNLATEICIGLIYLMMVKKQRSIHLIY